VLVDSIPKNMRNVEKIMKVFSYRTYLPQISQEILLCASLYCT
jgi:hypothetical protein